MHSRMVKIERPVSGCRHISRRTGEPDRLNPYLMRMSFFTDVTPLTPCATATA